MVMKYKYEAIGTQALNIVQVLTSVQKEQAGETSTMVIQHLS